MGRKMEIKKSHDSQLRKVDYKKNESATDFTNERTSFKSTLASSFSILKLQEAISERASFFITHYELGEAEKTDANVQKMKKLKPAVLIGSVDSTRFARKWHEAKWYKPYIDAAAQLSKCEKLLDPATKKWFQELKPALDVFLKLGTYTGSDRILKRKYRKDIWKLVKKNGSDIVYGKKGVLNFLLAFRRITNVHSKLKEVTKKDFKLDDLSVEQIKLTLGEGVGKKKGASDRFAYMIVKKEQKAQPKVKPASEPSEKALQFGGEEFCKKYEIRKPAEFKKDLDQFKEWVTDEKMKYLQDRDFWKKKPGETDAQTDARFMRLFADKKIGIRKLYVDLSGLDVYEKWFAEANDDASRKYKLLYLWVVKRMAEYAQKYESNSRILKDSLLDYHKQVMLTGSLLKGKSDKVVLMQFIDSSEYLMKNDDDVMERIKWRKLNAKYKKDFSK
jgi:hypothetical protein